MNIKLVFGVVGKVVVFEAAALFLTFFVAIFSRQQDWQAFLLSALIAAAAGMVIIFFSKDAKAILRAREGFVIVGASWLILSFFGSLPFLLSGAAATFPDAFFESVSGFTTTGATVLTKIEYLPNGILFWRSLTHWLGGMGVLILFMALLPAMGERSVQLLRAESPGPVHSKLVPKLGQTAKILYTIYILLTISEITVLLLTGMPLFDSVNIAMSTAGTGGFAINDASIGYYNSAAIEVIVGVFTAVFGVNFAIIYHIAKKNYTEVKKNTELKFYIAIVISATLLITVNISSHYGKFETALMHSFFQVSTIITTTGFSTADVSLWPDFSKIVIICLMISGACAGSTTGGIKISRVVIILKCIYLEIRRIVFPREVNIVRMDGRRVDDDVLTGVTMFLCTYTGVFLLAAALVSFDNLGVGNTLPAVLAALSNTGRGPDMFGTISTFAEFSGLSKLILSGCMLLGRLEIFPILLLLMPSAWKRP